MIELPSENNNVGAPCRIVSRGIDRVKAADMPYERFQELYAKQGKPVIIQGCMDNWKARSRWNISSLDESSLRNARVKCGEDDEGFSVKVKMKYFLQYVQTQQDDSPLYVFESSFDDKPDTKALLDDFQPPVYFRSDLFNYVQQDRRPPYRWFLIGPERSGSSLHTDPLSTNAWNALATGVKRWILYPPGMRKKYVKAPQLRQRGEDKEAITWFTHTLPRIKAKEARKPNGPDLGMIEFLQYPGEVVCAPAIIFPIFSLPLTPLTLITLTPFTTFMTN